MSRDPILGISYGPEVLDLYPASPGAPLMAFAHGGEFRMGDRHLGEPLVPAFNGADIWVALIEYSLAPAASVADQVEQIEAAVAFLYGNAAAYGFNREKISLAGHSAGGFLAVSAAIREARRIADTSAFPIIHSVAAISALFDLEAARLDPKIQPIVKVTKKQVGESPLRCQPQYMAPVIAAVGTRDLPVLEQQFDAFVSHWQALNLFVATHELYRADHFDTLRELGNHRSALFQTVRNFCRGGRWET